jgi:heat shock transcription factor, other eukaryote
VTGSFLDESKNTDLIRWSDSGDSFIVLDEEEFAKKLIPELFKHNNYASFVRQLNMYGFHKRVGLSDNSMKASERKNKSPSEYWNPYFRRGHPNLLWLINKPKSTSSKKKGKKEDGEPDDDEEVDVEDMQAAQGFAAIPGQASNSSAQGEVGPLQSRQVAAIKSQLDLLQQQQKVISESITRMRRENTAMLEQALAFQNMHERHENSINAILNFLANVFRKSLEDQGGAQNVQDLLASIIPGAGGQTPIPQGSVFEMPDLSNQSGGLGGVGMSPPKRQQRLLMPIPSQGRASTVTPSSSNTPAQTPYNPPTGSVTELFDTSPSDSATPNLIHQELQSNPQEGMMRIINDTNANANSTINLPDMANNTAASLSNDQRNQMLRAMAGNAGGTPTIPSLQPDGMSAAVANAGASPSNANLSLSPLTKSAVPPPSLHDIANRTTELEQLEKLQTEQAAKLSELSNYLSPLSPSGRIPGLDDNGYFDNNIDLDQFVDPNAFNDLNYTGNDFTSGSDGNGFDNYDFSALTSAADEGAPATIATAPATDLTQLNSSNMAADTPSEAATEEIPRDDLDSPERESKRQRRT